MNLSELLNPKIPQDRLLAMLHTTLTVKAEGEIFKIPLELFKDETSAQKFKDASVNIILLTP